MAFLFSRLVTTGSGFRHPAGTGSNGNTMGSVRPGVSLPADSHRSNTLTVRPHLFVVRLCSLLFSACMNRSKR